MMEQFQDQANNYFKYTRDLRRDFHRFPELGFQEFRTAGIVSRELNSFGLEVATGIGKTGVVGLLETDRPGPVLFLRFDMDALPIQEETGASYASENLGVMHACGHDAHTAIGLTVARILVGMREKLSGTIKFVFQPAEEGLGGAESMIEDGVLQNPRPDHTVSLHLWNNMPIGWWGISDGPVMAASDIFKVTISGKGGHGALPHLSIDPILASSHFVTALQSIISRNIDPLDTAVISVTTIHGGDAHNVIPPKVEMTGTIRTFKPDVRATIYERFLAIANQSAEAFGCNADVDLQLLTPAVKNEPEITKLVDEKAGILFPDDTIDRHFQTTGSEDMAYFMEEIPGCYIFVGSADSSTGKNAPHHHPKFDIDERVLPKAVALMTSVVARILG